MVSRFEVWLNGVALSSISDDIYIRDIKYTPPSFADTVHTFGGRSGGIFTKRILTSTTVQIDVELHSYLTDERSRLCEEVAAWAISGGKLQLSDRPGRMLMVRLAAPPTITSALDWTEALTIQFSAFPLPYWQDELPITAEVESGTPGEMYGAGFAEPPFLEAVITPSAAGLTTLSLETGAGTISFTGLTGGADDVVTLGLDAHGLFTAKLGSASILANRTPESADDLRLSLGMNTVTLTSNIPTAAALTARGLYL